MIPVTYAIGNSTDYDEGHLNPYHIEMSFPSGEGYYVVFMTNGKKLRCKGNYSLFLSRIRAILKG